MIVQGVYSVKRGMNYTLTSTWKAAKLKPIDAERYE